MNSIVFCLLLVIGTSIQAQQGNEEAFAGSVTGGKSINIPRLDVQPEIDGIMDEEAWAQAVRIDDFHQLTPIEYSEPSQRTEVWVFYSQDALYVGARMHETDPELITAQILRQGETLGADDLFMLIIDPFFDRRNGFEFEVNANGVREEGVYQNVTGSQRNWEAIWEAEASIDGQGWVAEIRIPFQTISFNPDTSQWGINFRRVIRRNDETMAWISRNRQVNPSIAGTATGMTGMRQGIGLDVVPYVLMRSERVFTPGGGSEETFEPQLDMFYKITPQLNAALTINTDFSATEVDNRQVNLTRFSLFFPERRDFFLRDSDIFDFGQIGQNGRPFFSRRIGLSSSGAPLDINAGAKLSGRIGDWSVGTLVVNQDGDEASGTDNQNVFVGRALLNVLSESQVGVIMTHGDPRSNLDSTLMGTDFQYRNSNLPGGKIVQSRGWYQQSDNEGVNDEDSAWGFSLSSPNNDGWRGGYNYMRIEDNFAPAVGFVNQAGIVDQSMDVGYRYYLPAGNFLRSVFGEFEVERTEDLYTGQAISEESSFSFSVNNNTRDSASIDISEDREVLDQDFTIHRAPDGSRTVTIPAGDYSFKQASANINFANQRPWSGRIGLTAGDYYTGTRFQRNANVGWRPGRYARFSLSYTENEIHLPEGNFTVRQVSLNSQVSFTSELAWLTLIQYDNVSESIGVNSRLHWIPKAGQQAFLVLNYGLSDRDRDNDFQTTNSDLTLKFNYTFRF